jgi:hypothetical protein
VAGAGAARRSAVRRVSLDLQLSSDDRNGRRRGTSAIHSHARELAHRHADDQSHANDQTPDASALPPEPASEGLDTDGGARLGGGSTDTGGGARSASGGSGIEGGLRPTGAGVRRRRRRRGSASPPKWALVSRDRLAEMVDVVVCLGGDGTLLWCARPRFLRILGFVLRRGAVSQRWWLLWSV